ncbi:Hypothetical protein POVN_LOCUS215 [uncultured virus]|nr:Hypothetical protein POVN_LOCUS215 [uncultured virus]
MPLYTDSVILNAVGESDRILTRYGARALKVTATSRPAKPVDVWVVTLSDADTLQLYRGEYRLGIIATGTKTGYVHGNYETKLQALDGPLTQPLSGACRVLIKYREVLPRLEQRVKDAAWEGKDSIEEDADFIQHLFPVITEAKLTREDVAALAAFRPYTDMVKRAFRAIVTLYGHKAEGKSLKMADSDRFLKFLARGGKNAQNYQRVSAILQHLRELNELNQGVVAEELEALRGLVVRMLAIPEYKLPEAVVAKWTEEVSAAAPA